MYRLCLALILLSFGAQAAVEYSAEPETGLGSWHADSEGVAITFNQRLPDQSRAFFQGRGFAVEAAEQVAGSCVFQSIIRNHSEEPVALDLALWRKVVDRDAPQPIRLEPDWQGEWERQGVPQPARIAFRWALFPTRQQFQPGDWSMGMITVDLPAGERFDLEVVWEQGGEPRRLRFEGMRCAPDRHL